MSEVFASHLLSTLRLCHNGEVLHAIGGVLEIWQEEIDDYIWK